MPELPEVESVRRQLDPELAGRRVEDAWWDPHPALPRQFMGLELLAGRRVLRVGRRGKFMIAPLDEDLELILHLGMTGSFRFDLEDPHVRAKLSLDDGRTLSFRDVRRFGRMASLRGSNERAPRSSPICCHNARWPAWAISTRTRRYGWPGSIRLRARSARRAPTLCMPRSTRCWGRPSNARARPSATTPCSTARAAAMPIS